MLATGAFQAPTVPGIAEALSSPVIQFTPDTYKDPAQIPKGKVLVVGDDATGRDAANDLSFTHQAVLSTGHSRKLFPERFLGKSTWWWLDKLGILRLSDETWIVRYLNRIDAFPARNRSLISIEQHGVELVPKLMSANGKCATFANEGSAEIEVVIWTTGYRDNSG